MRPVARDNAADFVIDLRDVVEAFLDLTWTIYKVAAKQTRLGEVEAADEREAIEKGAKEFKVIASKLIAVRR